MTRLVLISLVALVLTSCQTTNISEAPQYKNIFSGDKPPITVDEWKDTFSKRSLKSLEGVWLWDDSAYEIAIVKAPNNVEYDYLGVIINADRGSWKPGDVKLEMKATVSRQLFLGNYYGGDKTSQGVSFKYSENLIETRYGNIPIMIVRSYPTAGDAQKREGVVAGKSYGSGFFVNSRDVLTNAHVLDGCQTAQIVLDGNRIEGTIHVQDVNNDLAIVRTPEETAAVPVNFRNDRTINPGEPVSALGFPLQSVLAKQMNITTGSITSLAGINNDIRFLQFSAPTQAGNSGGPLFDRYGNLVGVITSKLNALKVAMLTGDIPQNTNFAIRTEIVRSFLDINGVAHSQGDNQSSLSPEQVYRSSLQSVVSVNCTVK